MIYYCNLDWVGVCTNRATNQGIPFALGGFVKATVVELHRKWMAHLSDSGSITHYRGAEEKIHHSPRQGTDAVRPLPPPNPLQGAAAAGGDYIGWWPCGAHAVGLVGRALSAGQPKT